MTNAETKPLNKLEVWVAEHAVPIFGVIALLIVVGAVAVFVTYQEQSGIAERVKVLVPQVTKVNKAICDKQSLNHPQRAARCAERIRVGLVNCRHSQPCRAALLAAITYPPPAQPTAPSGATPRSGGGDAFQPATGHQQPGPGEQPGHEGGQDGPPTPSPGPSGPAAAEPGPPAESPGNGAQGSPGGSSSSGPGVELCVLEHTCVGAEVGLGGLTGGDPE